MNNFHAELVYAFSIVAVLVLLAGYFGWRSWRCLRRGPDPAAQLPGEGRFERAQAWRRLVASGLMVVLAGLLVGSYVVGQEGQARKLGATEREVGADGQPRPLSAEEKLFLTRYGTFWVIFGVLLLVLVGLAFADFLAIRRYARRNLNQIRADRRAMIERQVAELRRQRNGF